MSTTLSLEKKIWFTPLSIFSFDSKNNITDKKLVSAIKSLWNNKDGKHDNTKFKIVDSSGKGFYDRSGEFIILDKKNKILYLCEASTSYSGRWDAKDDIRIIGKKNILNQNMYGGVFG